MKLSVIKIGGNIIDDDAALLAFLKQFAALEGHKILIHGGGKIATALGSKLGIETRLVDGRRITDKPTLDLVTMVYGGLIGRNIAAGLQALGCNAISLTGADGGSIKATRRPVTKIDYGHVGDLQPDSVNVDTINKLLAAGMTPVFAPLSYDGYGGLLNTNADTIAQEVAKALAKTMHVQLLYCFEKSGVLSNPTDETSVIKKISQADFQSLKSLGVISGGMIPKIENALAAVNHGVKQVIIGHAANLIELIKGESGTWIQ